MRHQPLDTLRVAIRRAHRLPQSDALSEMLRKEPIDTALRERIGRRAVDLVRHIRQDGKPRLVELFLSQYGLSADEGVALMCLAEALLRVPDGTTMDALIEDKIATSAWGNHLGCSNSLLVNTSTWVLLFTGKVLTEPLDRNLAGVLRGAIKRLGEPVIRQAVNAVMKLLGSQFVLGETMSAAMGRAGNLEKQGFTYSYDMLGEAACTAHDAERYWQSYAAAIKEIGAASTTSTSVSDEIRNKPGISVKLSALHPRYEAIKQQRVEQELVDRVLTLAQMARAANIGFNIDAEEAARLDLSLNVIEQVFAHPSLRDWSGFGVVVQAYSQRAPAVIDWLYGLATQCRSTLMVRLVKGAYWDTEIKLAQVQGHSGYPVFVDKCATDVSYLCCAHQLLAMTDRLYPQFASHNAHTVAAVLEIAGDERNFEFQRLHGMGEALHHTVLEHYGTRCRIYAPVGEYRELLAYLVRRLLENGANSSFVNQIVDARVPPELVAADPFDQLEARKIDPSPRRLPQPRDLFQPLRLNSAGWDLDDTELLSRLHVNRQRFADTNWSADEASGQRLTVLNPATGEAVGTVRYVTEDDINAALARVCPWDESSVSQRGKILRLAADLYEAHADEIFALLACEAGKTIADAVAELREAVDFLRYYAARAEQITEPPVGVFLCISPWNFPLAIFTGQIAAALGTGNGVIAKPSEEAPLIANLALRLLHQAGVPHDVLVGLQGDGAVGARLVNTARFDGVCFTGSILTAQHINRVMARTFAPQAPLIAETGGINAMIVDSTALPEKAIEDIITSAFQSAGQRCSALRVVYLQTDIAHDFLRMLFGAMDELQIGDPMDFATDIGPVISDNARQRIDACIAQAKAEGRLVKQLDSPGQGAFVGPAVIRVRGIEDVAEEVFGPVLHVATYRADEFSRVLDAINARGYGLTFGIHSRIDDRVQQAIDQLQVGNLYVNRNQIGAVVGSQPFGGEGLSGTGPKAGGPNYLSRFVAAQVRQGKQQDGRAVSSEQIEIAFSTMNASEVSAVDVTEMPGPTGESNVLGRYPRGCVLCLGPSAEDAAQQMLAARKLGCRALAIAPGTVDGLDGVVTSEALKTVSKLDAVVSWSSDLGSIRQALAEREGPIVPLLCTTDFTRWLLQERHVCVDTTAAGGNAALMAE